MSTFGPFYPVSLQETVNHAERLCEVLVAYELSPPCNEWAAAWTVGRADEVARFAEHVTASWRAGQLAEGDASETLHGYLASVHEGMALHLGRIEPPCCAGESDTTRPLPPSDGSRTIFDGDPIEANEDAITLVAKMRT
jgi:hypothetical protein